MTVPDDHRSPVPPTNRVSYDFSGSRALVTGGTSGIGHAIARAFLDAGAEVIVTGTRAGAADYDTDLSGLAYRQFRLTDPDGPAELLASLDEPTRGLDVLVNNAGANLPGGRDEWRPEVFAESVDINLTGAFRLVTACRDLLSASSAEGGASVVNMVSMAAMRAVPMVPGYGAGKAGLLQLTQNLAVHWAGDGIRVNAVAPGVILTPMTAPMLDVAELVEPQLAHIPMGRLGSPAEVAPAVLYLSSAQAAYVTGHTLAVDGGYLAF